MKKLLLSMTGFLLTCSVFAQVPGDYISAADGNWNVNASWQMFSGGSWVAATSYPGQNAGTNEVSFRQHMILLSPQVYPTLSDLSEWVQPEPMRLYDSIHSPLLFLMLQVIFV